MNSETSFNRISNKILNAILLISIGGFIDASYLTAEHFLGNVPACSFLSGCETVTQSVYATIGPIPIALLGVLFYLSIFVLTFLYKELESKKIFSKLFLLASTGFAVTLFLLFIQAFVLHAFCIYCLTSAATSISIFTLVFISRKRA